MEASEEIPLNKSSSPEEPISVPVIVGDLEEEKRPHNTSDPFSPFSDDSSKVLTLSPEIEKQTSDGSILSTNQQMQYSLRLPSICEDLPTSGSKEILSSSQEEQHVKSNSNNNNHFHSYLMSQKHQSVVSNVTVDLRDSTTTSKSSLPALNFPSFDGNSLISTSNFSSLELSEDPIIKFSSKFNCSTSNVVPIIPENLSSDLNTILSILMVMKMLYF
jgi:hypothetical protein